MRFSRQPVRISSLLLGLWLLAAPACAPSQTSHPPAFQTSTIAALLAGAYDGDFSFAELHSHGDFGLGTFDAIDGEMIAFDGSFYRIGSDGRANTVADSTLTPFSVVTFFRRDRTARFREPLEFEDLKRGLDELASDGTAVYAVRIEGKFSRVRTRSVPRQFRPYRRLVEVVQNQPTFSFEHVSGTLVGFRFPETLSQVNVPGWHFHFLTADRKAGGHVLDCQTRDVLASFQRVQDLIIRLPTGTQSGSTQPNPEPEELRAVEQ